MSIFDVVLLIILAGFTFYGLFFGLIRAAGALAGVVVGAWAASHYYLTISQWAENLFFGYNNLGKVLVFILIFTIANRLVGLAFAILDRTFDVIAIIPFLKTINRLAGAIFGFLAGTLILGLIIYVSSRYTIIDHWLGRALANSKMVPFLIKSISILLPLLPDVLKKLKSVIKI